MPTLPTTACARCLTLTSELMAERNRANDTSRQLADIAAKLEIARSRLRIFSSSRGKR